MPDATALQIALPANFIALLGTQQFPFWISTIAIEFSGILFVNML